mmetsp:Transcript_34055/g.90738  ORF Transcript_34055/g.90738 Transcript_34055/m.90738 type:complete len:157 (-) Transcript_34055:189-659(-)
MGDWWGGVNRALRISHVKQTETKSMVQVLPDWVKLNARLCYVSRRNGQSHHVFVKKIEQRRKVVLITFEQDPKVWKRIAFNDIKKLGDGALRPLWKKAEATATEKPRHFAAESEASGSAGPANQDEPENFPMAEEVSSVFGPQLPESESEMDERVA